MDTVSWCVMTATFHYLSNFQFDLSWLVVASRIPKITNWLFFVRDDDTNVTFPGVFVVNFYVCVCLLMN